MGVGRGNSAGSSARASLLGYGRQGPASGSSGGLLGRTIAGRPLAQPPLRQGAGSGEPSYLPARFGATSNTNPSGATPGPSPFVHGGLIEPFMQLDAGVRSAANSMTFGGADNLSAGLDSVLGYGGQGDLGQRYQTLLQWEHARDSYDEAHRPIAHGLGDLAGTLLLAEAGGKVGSTWPAGSRPRLRARSAKACPG